MLAEDFPGAGLLVSSEFLKSVSTCMPSVIENLQVHSIGPPVGIPPCVKLWERCMVKVEGAILTPAFQGRDLHDLLTSTACNHFSICSRAE